MTTKSLSVLTRTYYPRFHLVVHGRTVHVGRPTDVVSGDTHTLVMTSHALMRTYQESPPLVRIHRRHTHR